MTALVPLGVALFQKDRYRDAATATHARRLGAFGVVEIDLCSSRAVASLPSARPG